MNSTGILNLNIKVEMKQTGVAEVDTGLKMKPHEQKMKPTGVGNLNIEVKMNETGVEKKPIEQILFDGFCLEGDGEDFSCQRYHK